MSSPTAAKAGPPIKVLVVDDEAAHAEAVDAFIEKREPKFGDV